MRSSLLLLLTAAGTLVFSLAPAWSQNPPVIPAVEKVRFFPIDSGENDDWREFYVDVDTNPTGGGSSFTWVAQIDGTSGSRLTSTTGNVGESLKVLVGDPSLPEAVKVQILDSTGAVAAIEVIELGSDSIGDTRVELIGDDCGGCEKDCASAGASSAGLESLFYRLTIGAGNYGAPASLIIRAEDYHAGLYTPSELIYVGGITESDGYKVTKAGSAIDWIRTPTTFTKIESITSTGYYISIYHHDDVNKTTNTPSGTPLRKVRVHRPTTNELRIDEITGGKGLYRRYKYTASPKKWELWEGSSTELTDATAPRKTVLTVSTSGSTDTVNKKVYGWDYFLETGNHPVYEEERTYVNYPGGRVETSIRVDPNGQNYTTNKTWHTDSGSLQGRLKSVTYPDGYWNYYTYTPGGLLAAVYAPFGDTSTPAATSSGTEWIQYTYSLSGGVVIKRETRHNNILVEREWLKVVVGTSTVTTEHQQAPSTDAVLDSAANLKTIITRNKTTNRITQIDYPDGQKTTHSYSGGSYSGWTYSGETHSHGSISSEPAIRVTSKTGIFSGSTLTEGVTTEIERNQVGEILARKQTGMHPTGGTRIFYDSLAYVQDEFKRITGTQMEHRDGAYTLRVYDCCTLRYEVDELGMARETNTDVLSRVRESYYGVFGASSITTYVEKLEYKLDGMGRRRAVVRHRLASDGTPATITVERNTYNKAGELTSRTDALNFVTTYSRYVSGTRLHEIVSRPSMGNPSGFPTEYTQYYRDGTIKERRTYAASAALSTIAVSGSMIEWLKYSRSATAGSGSGFRTTTVTSAGSAGTGTTRWETTRINMIGEIDQISRPRGNGSGTTVTEHFTYGTAAGSSKGRLIRHVDPDGVTTRYAYSNLGEVFQTARDRNTSSTASINLSDDNVTETVRYWTVNGSSDIVERLITEAYSVNGSSATKKVVRQVDRHRNGWKTWTTSNGQQTISELTSTANGWWTTTVTHPDGSKSKTAISYGLPNYESHETASGGIIRKITTSTFDGHRRVTSLADHRFGTTTLGYNNRDDLASETRPNPAGGTAVTYGYNYDSNGNLTTVNFPSSAGTQTTEYHANGLVKKRSGMATSTTEYLYNSFGGQLTTMKTLYGSTSATANTTWIYDSYRGWLSGKRDHSNDGANYQYTAAGRLSKRTWDRGDYVNYSYTDAGELRLADYADVTPGVITPDIEYSYNRTGTLAWAKDGTWDGSTFDTLRYTHNNYFLADYPFVLNYTRIADVHTEIKYLRQRYDTGVVNRPTGYQLGTLLDPDNDMETAYSYVANDGRLHQVTTESFETHTDTFTYTYGSAGQYGPTILSGPQIHATKSYLTAAPYFDTIDNKTSSGGSTVSKADYRYDSLGRRDRKDFTGSAYGTATYDAYAYNANFEVTQGKRYTSGGSAVSGKEFNFTYDDIGNRLTSKDKFTSGTDTTYAPNPKNQYTSITGYHGASPVTYDTDGNLTALGSKTFIYNGENQLIEVKIGGNSVATFKYDYLGRRVEKSTPSKTETYAYDGWNLIAIYDTGTTDKRPLITYSWGLDLSDTRQGAGGVGGLLMSCERDGAAWTYFEDGHGNVTQVVSQSTGSVSTHMEYDPYGNLVTTTPAWTKQNAFRFSSKFYDVETGLYYYGFRYYDSVHGRWLNRDPIGEEGGANLYSFVDNDGIGWWDWKGQTKGGKQKISVEHNGKPITPKTPVADIDNAIKEAKAQGMSKAHQDKLKGIRKVANRLKKFKLAGGAAAAGAYLSFVEVFGVDLFDPDTYLPDEIPAVCWEVEKCCWECECPDERYMQAPYFGGGGNDEKECPKGSFFSKEKPKVKCLHKERFKDKWS